MEKYLETLRTRIDILEIKSNDKNKPWYKTVTGISAVLAIILSIISIFYSMEKDRSDDLASKRKEIRENVNNMLSLDAISKREADSLKVSHDSFVSNHYEIKEKFEIYLNNIDAINADIPGKLSTEIYLYIGLCYFHYSYRNNKIFNYTTEAIKVAKDNFDTANVYLALANTYYATGVFLDTPKARNYLMEDINTLKHIPDSRGYFYLIRDYANAAADHEAFLDSIYAIKYIDSAKVYCNFLKQNQYLHSSSCSYVNEKIKQMPQKFKNLIDTLIL